jgi:hypothetical protein
MRKLLPIVLSVALVLALGTGLAVASTDYPGHPSAKATAKVGDLYHINETTAPDWVTVLNNTIKTPNQKALFIDVSLECGLYTLTQVKSKNAVPDTSTSMASILVRVLVDNEVAYPGNVTFARRSQTMTAVFQGIIQGCLECEDGVCVINQSCVQNETLELILDTMSANSFNFIADNFTAGVHNVKVQVKIVTSADIPDKTEAFANIGLGSVTIEEVRLIRGEDIWLE